MNAKNADYLVIGGYAVNYHGYSRSTDDMDVWVAMTPENAQRVVGALREFGFNLPELSEKLFLLPDKIIRMGIPPVRIEISTTISGVDFAECQRRAITATLDGVPVPLISLADLRKNKQASGRDKDLVDLARLRED